MDRLPFQFKVPFRFNKIEGVMNRRATFLSKKATFLSKKNELFTKARHLAFLCDAEVAVLVFSDTGVCYNYSSTSLKETLLRYSESEEASRVPESATNQPAEAEQDLGIDDKKLRMNQLRITKEELVGFDFMEVRQLEQQLKEGLALVMRRKEELMVKQIMLSKQEIQERQKENEELKQKIAQLQDLLPPSNDAVAECSKEGTSGRNDDDDDDMDLGNM